MFAGQLIAGSSVSRAVTTKLQVVSPSVQVTVVLPRGKLLPEAGVQVTVPHGPLVVGVV
jgi:hypothetical protein